LPWGLEIEVDAQEGVGYAITTGLVFDPCVSEVLYRLLDSGETAMDVGAHVGYMTSIMAATVGPSGSVSSFEPHPLSFDRLARNTGQWSAVDGVANIQVTQCALSSAAGRSRLREGPGFSGNSGLAQLVGEAEPSTSAVSPGEKFHDVTVRPVDEVLGASARIDLLKIDVEGHELDVLEGAKEALRSGRVRDIVFEEHRPAPNPATELLESCGYGVFGLRCSLRGVKLAPATSVGPVVNWAGQSYLATNDPARAAARLRRRGWMLPGIGPGWRRAAPGSASLPGHG
jgi:FkbM family methyltransferase